MRIAGQMLHGSNCVPSPLHMACCRRADGCALLGQRCMVPTAFHTLFAHALLQGFTDELTDAPTWMVDPVDGAPAGC